MQDKADTLTFNSEFKPDLVNVDGDKVLLVKKTDDKPLDQFVFQYFNAPLYVDRTEAITAATKHQDDKGAQKVLISALHDKYYRLQLKAIKALDMKNDAIRNAAMPILASLAQTDPNTLVRAAAIAALGNLKASGNMDIFTAALSSRSYAIQGAALTAISKLDSAKALTIAKGFEADNMDDLTTAMVGVYATSGNSAEWPFVYKQFHEAHIQMKFNLVREFAAMTARVDNTTDAQQGILELKATAIQYKMYGADQFIIGLFNGVIKPGRAALHDDVSVKLIDTTIQEIQAAK
jgi:aminopeptidase N